MLLHRLRFDRSIVMSVVRQVAVILTTYAATAFAQDAKKEETDKKTAPSIAIEIPDEPRSVDPIAFVPKELAAKATVKFVDSSLGELTNWLHDQTKFNVVLDRRALESVGVHRSDPIFEELRDAPVYQLLDRLRVIGVTWHVANGVLHLTSFDHESNIQTSQYNIGDLIDAGYSAENFEPTIRSILQEFRSQKGLEKSDGASSIVLIGDVLFLRESNDAHRHVAGFLAALRKHGRRTLVNDPPENERLRRAVLEKVSIRFQEKPLSAAIDELANIAKVDIRLNRNSLAAAKISDRAPMTLDAQDESLRTILDLLLKPHQLSWEIRNGVMWVVSPSQTPPASKTAVFDVRDLCLDIAESNALQTAIIGQIGANRWPKSGDSIRFPLVGTMVIHQTEQVLDDTLQLLENYRVALRASKPRPRRETDPKEVVIRYYRMPTIVADELETALPELVRQETWKGLANPNAVGTIRKLHSWAVSNENSDGSSSGRDATPYSVLVITQMREVHELIPDLLTKIEYGEDGQAMGSYGGGGFGGGGGGFGGGFFAIPSVK